MTTETAEDRGLASAIMASHIASCYRPFRLDQAKAILLALDRLDSYPDNEAFSKRCDFISIGATDSLEDVLSYTLAGSVGLPVTLDAVQAIRELADIAAQPNTAIDSRQQLTEAILLSDTSDSVWTAVSILARIPRLDRATVMIDIKTGEYPPALTYDAAFELGKALLKLCALLGASCQVLLTDSAATDSLAFGRRATQLSLISSLSGGVEPYVAVSRRMVAEALCVAEPGISRDAAVAAVSDALTHGMPMRQARKWNLLQQIHGLDTQAVPSEGSTTHMTARSAGYVRRLNGSKIRAELEAFSRRNQTKEEVFVKVLVTPGQKLSLGDVIGVVGGGSSEQARQRIADDIYPAFDIARESLSAHSTIRVTMLPETALIRRQVALALPVTKGPAGTKVFLPYAREEHSPYIVYFDSSSFFSSTDEIASMIARKTVPPAIKYTISRIGVLTSRRVVYELATNNVLSPRIAVFAILLDSVAKEIVRDTDIGRWIDADQLDFLNTHDLPKDIADDWTQIAHFLRTAITEHH